MSKRSYFDIFDQNNVFVFATNLRQLKKSNFNVLATIVTPLKMLKLNVFATTLSY